MVDARCDELGPTIAISHHQQKAPTALKEARIQSLAASRRKQLSSISTVFAKGWISPRADRSSGGSGPCHQAAAQAVV
ncbi:hypothetical protein [Mesorhizobium sp. DCY119]|uniref:hypothetical protein n=1 Tax=Mesorhizobium sp. DCY119 TaxID=2108445 RepID=UPI0010585EBD|nr:hypothetical protein [Mesorhizobium sp. DCY119]